MTVFQILVIAVAFIVAGTAKGAVGLGLPPIAIGIMTTAVPLSDALAILTLPTLLTNVFQAFYGGHFKILLRRFGLLSAMAVVGVLATGVVFGKLGSPEMLGWLGTLLVVYACLALFAWRPVMPRAYEPWASPLIGLSSGVVAGLTGMAAVPFLPYMQSLQITRDQLVQGLGIIFLCIMFSVAGSLFQQNVFTTDNSIGSVLALAPTFAGVWVGQKVRNRASPEAFRKIFLFAMLALGLNMARGLL